jgi:hypothetical protein
VTPGESCQFEKLRKPADRDARVALLWTLIAEVTLRAYQRALEGRYGALPSE